MRRLGNWRGHKTERVRGAFLGLDVGRAVRIVVDQPKDAQSPPIGGERSSAAHPIMSPMNRRHFLKAAARHRNRTHDPPERHAVWTKYAQQETQRRAHRRLGPRTRPL